MKTENQQPNSHTPFLSIDEWQDDEPMKGSWFDNPLLGSLGVIGAVASLFALGAILPQEAVNQEPVGGAKAAAAAEAIAKHADTRPQAPLRMDNEPPDVTGADQPSGSGGLSEALAGLNTDFPVQSLTYLADKRNFDAGQKRVVQDRIMELLKTKPHELQNNLEVFSVWFDTDDSGRISALLKTFPSHNASYFVGAMSKLPNPVPALIAEMAEHPANGEVHRAISRELSNHQVHPVQISRQLATKLQASNNAQEFERLVLLLKSMSWETRSDQALKKQIASAMAAAGQKLTANQFQGMSRDVADGITTFAQLPESSDLLAKLAASNDGASSVQMFLSRNNQNKDAGDLALKLARGGKLPLRQLLSYQGSELVQEFLWGGKMKAEREFMNLKLNSSTVSARAFSKAGVSVIDSEPDSIDCNSLLFEIQRHKQQLTREGMSDPFLQKLDGLLADRLDKDLSLTAKSSSPASLKLAERFGGKQAALAIARPVPKKALIIGKFKGILGALVALNQPETYETIVNAWINHSGTTPSLKGIGKAIEPNFLRRVKIKLKKLDAGDKRQKRTIPLLINALGQTGTSESVPQLEELKKSKIESFRKASTQALKKIRGRLGRE
ncbi:MAG: hypothetical protein AB8G99_01315 [Planctomycetaceae bacterium]